MNPTGRQNAGLRGRIAAKTQPMFHRILQANAMTVRQTLGEIRDRFAHEVSADTLGRLELVLAEVLNNVTEHAGESDFIPLVHLCIVRHEAGLACAITDDGMTLPAECLLPRALPEACDFPEGGFGWYLIQDLTQALCYYRESQRNFLAFTVPFAAPESVN
ncbi:ATP-binding protein [Paracoccus sp. (in: a-proteobacteria)]|uniref:ATP-binding protein n=1 Tax=Paracoccus sp. TaxID=267 RepID=UPI003A89C8CA